MQNKFHSGTTIQPDLKADHIDVRLEISAPAVFRNWKDFDWPNYVRACRESLHRVAVEDSVEILTYSVHPDFEHESVSHHVRLRGVLVTRPLRIARALRPSPGYRALDFLMHGIEQGWYMNSILKAEVERQRLRRHDHAGRPLGDSLPEQLLARALTETKWRLLLSPSDTPWAYINTATHRLYRRQYQGHYESGNEGSEVYQKRAFVRIETDNELQIENTPGLWKAAGLTKDTIAVLLARAAGIKWREMPAYLTDQTGASVDAQRVEAARGKLRRLKTKLRAAGWVASQWKPRSTSGSVYRERVPDGVPWGGLWTYAHRYQGEELEILGELARQDWNKRFRKN
jgi:hypothetical protein